MSKILALDTALDYCSVAVRDGERVTAHSDAMSRGHSERLIPLVNEILARAGISYGDLDAIAVTVGPGAFTGMRIGLSAARALGLALDIPVIGIGTFDVLLRQLGGDAAVVIETKRTDFYTRIDGNDVVMTAQEIMDALSGRSVTLIGDGLTRLALEISPDKNWLLRKDIGHPDPAILAVMAAEMHEKNPDNLPPPEPVYLRGADVSQSKRKNRTIAAE